MCLVGDAFGLERIGDFSLPDLEGRAARLKDFRSKTVLYIFGTTWCPSCRAEIPHFKDIYGTYGTRGLEVLYVNIMESREKVRRFVQRYRIPYRTLLDERGEFADAVGVRGVPTMILTRDGMIITRRYHEIDGQLELLFGRR